MNIAFLCTHANHPINPLLAAWIAQQPNEHKFCVHRTVNECTGGDLLFLISCYELVRASTRQLYRRTVVIHASDLPDGKGWSPHIWDILEGRQCLTVSLLNAEDSIDSGDIWKKINIPLSGTELFDEINAKLFAVEFALIEWMLQNYETSEPVPQNGTGRIRRRRVPEDSRLDPAKSIAEQFDLLRVCDSERFPAFFDLRGTRYTIHLTKAPSP